MAHDNTAQEECFAKIEAILNESVAAGVPGLSAAIYSARGQWTFTTGVSDLQKLQPVETTHLFGIGSITKVLVAVVVLQLIEEERLQLSDSVGKILSSEVYAGIDDGEDATVMQLLSHTAGIDSWEDDPLWIRKGRGSETDPAHVWKKSEPLEYIHRSKTTAPDPGQYYYSNTNYTLLGLIIENVTKSTVEAEIRQRIIEPLGMEHIFLEGFERPNKGLLPRRYHWATDTFRDTAGICSSFPELGGNLIDCTSSNLSTEWAAGGMVSSASDLVKFAAALRDGRLLRPESLAVMKDWRPTTGPNEVGHGLFRMKRSEDSVWLGHFGGVLGFTGALWWAEKGDCIICVLSNVGVMHAGDVPSSAAHLILKSQILELASRLAAE
ncbi:D-alanyl-D-alanine carboxypeptidase-like protein [Cladobotryum mycophilum]|uniref:D-alanyl-D-alanine carboxypeptidase-like protein n=1 Tax=Cladobotryum mycophilum TaxID=491253 RepID=A0ABR0SPQ7_9HYPO